MSYIRAYTNPEKLYVFESENGIEFWWGENINNQVVVNASDFMVFMLGVQKEYNYITFDPIKYRNISIQEVWSTKDKIYTKEPKKMVINFKVQYRLTIKKKHIYMYPVTWYDFYNEYFKQLNED